MKLWIDDLRPAPYGYVWCKSVKEAKWRIESAEDVCTIFPLVDEQPPIELIDIDHDAGEFAKYGGDYIKLLDWLEETGRNYPIRIHSMNSVGRMNMEAICHRNGWTIVE